MKIGIITHHYINNFGAFLQTYALQCAAQKLAPDAQVQIIDYVNRKHAFINTLGWFRFRNGRDNVAGWLDKVKVPHKFAQVRQRYLNLSPRVSTPEEINALGYDSILVGSDEVWNYADGKSFDQIKFGRGLNCPNIVAYAPSVGQSAELDGIPDFVKDGLAHFSHLSARDERTERIVQSCGYDVQRVLDPTFLTELPYEPTNVKKPYILFYYCERMPEEQLNSIYAFAKEHGYAVYGAGECNPHFDARTINITPFQWTGMFRDAAYVVTGTFHGAVFSILNRRPFVCYMSNPSRMAKVSSLLDELGLDDRKISGDTDVISLLTHRIDYDSVYANIEAKRADSYAYLRRSLGVEQSARHDSAVPTLSESPEKDGRIKLFDEKSQCSGCSACANICSKKAITMITDESGFLYPQINHELCIRCGACKRVCGFQHVPVHDDKQQVYAAASKHRDVLMQSASGGVFAELAREVLQAGGVVFGAALVTENGKLEPRHVMIEDETQISRLQGSKYVQSEIGSSYIDAAKQLKAGRRVLFSGTPCQIASLREFIGKDEPNLFTVGIICHGVPSKKMFQDYLAYYGRKFGGTVTDYRFRDKKRGQGKNQVFCITMPDGTAREIERTGELTAYIWGFSKAEIFRESCYNCQFAQKKRAGDITLGDYWGIYIEHSAETKAKGLSNETGISCVLVNTNKGRELMTQTKGQLNSFSSDIDKVARHNEQLNNHSKMPESREAMMRCYNKGGYAAMHKQYLNEIGVKYAAYWLAGKAPKRWKSTAKTLIHKIRH